jgi:hypothetical protein
MGSKNFCRLAIIGFLAIPSVLLAWPIPDTGQTKCYDEVGTEIDCAGTGQDGQFLINPPSYTKLDANGNELDDTATEWVMVRDNVTGLIWEVKRNKEDNVMDYANPHDADNTYTWYDPNPATNGGNAGAPGMGTDTEDFISELNAAGFGGYTDWRLPTLKELVFLADYGKYDPSINTRYFPNSDSSVYWSSSNFTLDSDRAWGLGFYTGDSTNGTYNKSDSRYVRAVRGGQAGSLGHLVINDVETVTDSDTGLMWSQVTDGGRIWAAALAHCNVLNAIEYAGYRDWRLPTIRELVSVAAMDRYPAKNTEYFQGDPDGGYWSSSANNGLSRDSAWYVWFNYGTASTHPKSFIKFARAVRGGQKQIPGHLIIHQPRQASFWNVNSTMPITWDTANIQGDAEISISYAGGRPGTYRTIATSTPNDGKYDWTIESTPSFNCMLKIEPLSDPDKGTVQGLFSILGYLQASPASLGLQEPTFPGDIPESKTFAIRLASDPAGDLELELASANPTECSVSPSSVTLNSSNWDTGVTVTVTPEYDGVADGDQITSILVSTVDPLGAFQAVDLPLVQVIVKDSDTRTTLRFVSPALGEAGQFLTVTADGTNFDDNTNIYILSEGESATEISSVTFINDTTLSFTIPAQSPGSYNLKTGLFSGFELENAVSFVDSSEIAAQRRKKAIIVAGGEPNQENGFGIPTDKCSTHAYETFAFLGYDPADIQFLSGGYWKDITGDGENDVDADSSLATLQSAISALSGEDTDELLLYLVGPSRNGQFQFGGDADPEYLTPATLDSWLDALQGRISGRVVVVVDTPQSGGFLSALRPPSGKERIAITATTASEPAWFLDDGEISFSYRLFSHLFDNSELFSAFDKAKDDISALQTPQIDATGDGVPDLRRWRDGSDLVIGRGRSVEISLPDIDGFSANPSLLDDGSYSSSLSANGVEAPSGLSRIWCRIVPPIQVLRNPARPVLTAPAVKLFDLDSDGVYDGEYGEFFHDGQYRALAYAVDRAGAKSFPKEATVTQTQGIPMEIDPGDVNTDGRVDLADAIRALQVVAGMNAHALNFGDADGDEKIGLEDAVFILQTVGEVRR